MRRRTPLGLWVAAAMVVSLGACNRPSGAGLPPERSAGTGVAASADPVARASSGPKALDPRVYGEDAGGRDQGSGVRGQGAGGRGQGSGVRGQGAEREEKATYVVAAVGDSLTDARVGGGKFLAHLREKCPESRFDNYGVGGEMVNQMRRRFARDVLGEPPVSPPEGRRPPTRPDSTKPRYTHVIVFGGVNDLYSDLTAGRTVEKISRDLTAMYESARQRGVRVIALTVAPWGGFRRYYNEKRGGATLELNGWIKDQAQRGLVNHVVDAYALLSCGQPERLCEEYSKPFKDGLHFGPMGHKRLGEALEQSVFSDCR